MNSLIKIIFFISVTVCVNAISPPGTTCSSDGLACCPVDTATVCPIFMSNNGYGCCNIKGATCCPKSSTTQGCCPPETTCVLTGEYSATCVPTSGGSNISATQVCTPGARYAPSTTLPNVLYIGDSVSIGGEPVVANLSSSFAFVQHSPWSGGGGADDIGNGLNCQDAYLRLSDWSEAKWDIILFNFGLHDLIQTPQNKEFYASGLANFTSILQAQQPTAKLVYVTTTPFMPLRFYNNTIVEDLNVIAQDIMTSQKIPVIDTYEAVIKVCGIVYSSCSLCDSEPSLWPPTAPPGSDCGYHYTPAGWNLLGSVISNALKKIIGA